MPIIIAKVCGPITVVSLALGGDCPATVKDIARIIKQAMNMVK
jgi:hypothetical protein